MSVRDAIEVLEKNKETVQEYFMNGNFFIDGAIDCKASLGCEECAFYGNCVIFDDGRAEHHSVNEYIKEKYPEQFI